jgi:hypothetical protein
MKRIEEMRREMSSTREKKKKRADRREREREKKRKNKEKPSNHILIERTCAPSLRTSFPFRLRSFSSSTQPSYTGSLDKGDHLKAISFH